VIVPKTSSSKVVEPMEGMLCRTTWGTPASSFRRISSFESFLQWPS